MKKTRTRTRDVRVIYCSRDTVDTSLLTSRAHGARRRASSSDLCVGFPRLRHARPERTCASINGSYERVIVDFQMASDGSVVELCCVLSARNGTRRKIKERNTRYARGTTLGERRTDKKKKNYNVPIVRMPRAL